MNYPIKGQRKNRKSNQNAKKKMNLIQMKQGNPNNSF